MKKDIFTNISFLKYISDIDEVIPLTLSMDITNRCNFRCCHCYVKNTFYKKEEMTLKTIKNIIVQMYDYGIPVLYLSGGEPLERKDFYEIVEFAKGLDINVYIKTNGSLFTEDLISKLSNINIEDITISIYGMSNQDYNSVTGTKSKNMFDKVKKNIILMIKSGIKIKLRYVVLKENYKSLVSFVKWCNELKLSEAQFFHSFEIHPSCDCERFPIEHRISLHEEEELIRELYLLDPTYIKKTYNIPKKPQRCQVGKSSIHIASDGKVFPCPGFMISLGNVLNDTLKNIWENSEELSMLRKFEYEKTDCYSCNNREYCIGTCIGVLYNWNGHKNLFKCNEIFCRKKKAQGTMLRKLLEEKII